MSLETIALNEFLDEYATPCPDSPSRYFTKSQIFVAFRAFLARTQAENLVIVDYELFSILFEEEAKKRKINAESSGNSMFYQLFKKAINKRDDRKVKKPVSLPAKDDGVNIPLKDLNIFLCCKLCCGYLVDATTISECLHSFCKSCILKHFMMAKACPVCGTKVHNTKPVSSLKSDAVLQDIVNKLLPGASISEQERFKAYQQRKSSNTQDRVSQSNSVSHLSTQNSVATIFIEWVGVHSCTMEAEDLKDKYVRVCDKATIAHVSQYIVERLGKVDSDSQPTVDCVITCGGVPFPPILTLESILQNKLDFEKKKGVPHLKYDIRPIQMFSTSVDYDVMHTKESETIVETTASDPSQKWSRNLQHCLYSWDEINC